MMRQPQMIYSVLLLALVCVLGAKASVKFCCKQNELISEDTGECVPNPNIKIPLNSKLKINLPNKKIVEKDVLTFFKYSIGKPCKFPYALDNTKNKNDDWKLFENGTFYRIFDGVYLSEDQYCLQYYLEDEAFVIKPYNCPIENTEIDMKSYIVRVSVVFTILTAVIYLSVPKLRNMFGKCLISNLIAITSCYGILGFQKSFDIGTECQLAGYLCYFFYMAIFLWLLVSIYDLWSSTGLIEKQKESSTRFVIYSFCVWGVAAIFVCVAFLVDKSNIDDSLKPEVGVYSCWINSSDNWTSEFYLYGPMTILMKIMVLLLVLTANNIRIMNVATQQCSRLDSSNELSPNQLNFSLLIRIAVIICIWGFEILQFNIQKGKENQISVILCTICDVINASLGIIIFILFVLNPTVMNSISDWFKNKNALREDYKRSIQAQFSKQTRPNSTSSINNLI